jgi:hypothetical protein
MKAADLVMDLTAILRLGDRDASKAFQFARVTAVAGHSWSFKVLVDLEVVQRRGYNACFGRYGLDNLN